MKGKKILAELSPYTQGKQIEEIKKEFDLNSIVKLSSNENPYGFSENIIDNLTDSTEELHVYPDGYTGELRSALANKLNVSMDQLVFGSGSDELIQVISRAFLYPGTHTIMAKPTFPQYKHNSLIEGATISEIPVLNGRHDLNGMLKAINSDTKIIWLCSPDNPTGTGLEKESFYAFMNKCPKGILVVLDEAYYEFVDQEQDLQSLEHLKEYENLILLRTFSKAYGLAGMRVGYGIADKHIISKLDVVRGPFNTSAIAQNSALFALKDESFIQETVKKNRSVKRSFQDFLQSIQWKYFDTQTNFILVFTPISGTEVFQYLLERGFIVRPGELLGFPNTIRITIGQQEDMELLQEILHKLHKQLIKEI